jgi:hypothetical protein
MRAARDGLGTEASRFLGAGTVDQHNVIARQQQRLQAIAWRGQAVLCNLIIFSYVGLQFATGRIRCII